MKKCIYFLLTLFAAVLISSCADSNDDEEIGLVVTPETPETPQGNTSEAEYTICMYATAGADLDYSIIGELLDNVDEVYGTNGKVRFVGIYKASKRFQDVLGEDGGTRYFELTYKNGVTQDAINSDREELSSIKDSLQGLKANQAFINDFVGEKYAGDDFKMYEPDNISKALQFLTKKAPAKKYILLTDNHGGGWNFGEDLPTRAMLYDDCVGYVPISLDQLNKGVSMSGIKFDVLFCDLCLMAHIENLYGYSENFPICIASAETTTGSMVGLLAKRLATLGASVTHDQLFNECADWVTTTDSTTGYKTWDTYANLANIGSSDFQDMGCYDLTKIGNLTSSLQAISNWYIKALKDDDLKYVASKSVLTTLYTTQPDPHSVEKSLIRQDAIELIKTRYDKENMTADSIADEILAEADLYTIIQNHGSQDVRNFQEYQAKMQFGYPLAYFVWNTKRLAMQYNLTTAAEELDNLLNNYMNALKGMCKIKCSYDDFPGCTFDGVDYPAMDPYLWTSPTIVLASLNEQGYQFSQRVDYSPWAANDDLPLSKALTSYNNTKFDQLTNWSTFLQGINVNPCVITNPFRQIPVFYKKFGKVK